MVFSSAIFLFFFLPVTLLLVYFTHKYSWRNVVLLLLSMLFYIFGEGEMILLMMGSVTINYFLGIWIGRDHSRTALAVGVTINLLLLGIFKYTSFVIENLNYLFADLGLPLMDQVNIKLPLGISFYTFHSISYLVDVYRKNNLFQKSYTKLALYICLFPQLIAGPIIRYKDVASQLVTRTINFYKFNSGLQRFIIGLGKKVILANSLGATADLIFGLEPSELTVAASWFGVLCYALQLYFDFSGYSDMAIGLARILGFEFLENFNFPYKSKSIREFWQRWHISLSNWFRDYLYFPLGGSRVSTPRVYMNLFIVFFLTGLWHGASWNFVIWGMINGIFMIFEKMGLGKFVQKMPLAAQHFYALFVLMISFVFARSETLPEATQMLQSMFGFGGNKDLTLTMFTNYDNLSAFVVGAILSVNGFNFVLKKIVIKMFKSGIDKNLFKTIFRNVKVVFLILIFIYSALCVTAGSYNPFIYFRF